MSDSQREKKRWKYWKCQLCLLFTTGMSDNLTGIVISDQGWRQAQEDVVIIDEIFLNSSLFGIADGHAGNSCAQFLRDNLKYGLAVSISAFTSGLYPSMLRSVRHLKKYLE